MGMAMKRPIRVLAVDDSAVMRGILRTLFLMHEEKPWHDLPRMELCGMVEDGVECLAAVLRLRPDVVVLDLEMPRMHGLDVLERLHHEEPALPVIMCSSYTEGGARTTLDALALGAADYVMKPAQQSDFKTAMETLAGQLLPKIAALDAAGHMPRQTGEARPGKGPLRDPRGSGAVEPAVEIVVIGVSTGGPSALEAVLPKLAEDFAVPVMIVQHMPKLFTGALAKRLDRCCALRVREAHDGAELRAGTIWLAPGDAHMEIAEQGSGVAGASQRVVRLHQQRSLNHCKPSVDYLFTSAATTYGAGTLALVMTGMGADGLTGARRVHEAGGVVLAQDAATSAVWGMPGRVFQAGISRPPLALSKLADELTRRVNAGRSRPRSARTMAAAQWSGTSATAGQYEVMHELL